MKVITKRNVAALKRNAMNVYPLIEQRERLSAKIEELKATMENISEQIAATERGSMLITDGLASSDLIRRVVVETEKVDKNGMPVRQTKFELIPDRVILQENGTYLINFPVEPSEEPSNCVAMGEGTVIGEECYGEEEEDEESEYNNN